MYGSVHFHVGEAGMILKVILASVFKYEYAVGSKDISIKNKIGNIGQILQLIGGIGEYEVKLRAAAGYVFEYVTFYGKTFVCLDGIHDFAYEGVVGGVFLNAYHMGASS